MTENSRNYTFSDRFPAVRTDLSAQFTVQMGTGQTGLCPGFTIFVIKKNRQEYRGEEYDV